jgi:hypothetical protein
VPYTNFSVRTVVVLYHVFVSYHARSEAQLFSRRSQQASNTCSSVTTPCKTTGMLVCLPLHSEKQTPFVARCWMYCNAPADSQLDVHHSVCNMSVFSRARCAFHASPCGAPDSLLSLVNCKCSDQLATARLGHPLSLSLVAACERIHAAGRSLFE